jgi:hypothetical protein
MPATASLLITPEHESSDDRVVGKTDLQKL